MAEHKRYTYLHHDHCDCGFRAGRFMTIWQDIVWKVIHEEKQVTFECPSCGEVVAVFYREPELEIRRAFVDKAKIGQTCSAPRFVAWVGYAKNPNTILFSDDEVSRRAKGMLEGALNLELSDEQIGNLDWRIKSAMLRVARYNMRREIMLSQPRLAQRGFWFQDIPIEGNIVGTVSCRTGRRAVDNYYEDYTVYLADATYHNLYVVSYNDPIAHIPLTILVHPADILSQGAFQVPSPPDAQPNTET